jgi:hypothetical protein
MPSHHANRCKMEAGHNQTASEPCWGIDPYQAASRCAEDAHRCQRFPHATASIRYDSFPTTDAFQNRGRDSGSAHCNSWAEAGGNIHPTELSKVGDGLKESEHEVPEAVSGVGIHSRPRSENQYMSACLAPLAAPDGEEVGVPWDSLDVQPAGAAGGMGSQREWRRTRCHWKDFSSEDRKKGVENMC